MATKHSQAELIRLLEEAIRDVGDLDSKRFFLMVRRVVADGSPIHAVRAQVLLRFLPGGAPFCCGEPGCYSGVFRDDGAVEIGDYVRRKMNLEHEVSVELQVSADYYDGIVFSSQGRS